MCFWNAPLDDERHATHACQAALSMFRALDHLNEELRAETAGDGARGNGRDDGPTPTEEHQTPGDDGSVEALQRAAAQGTVEAQYKLAKAYRDGNGAAEDQVRAAEWFRRAADMGNINAQYQLGLMHFKGQGVPELTPHAACNLDYCAAREFGVDLVRTQTIADGAAHRDFRWKFPEHRERSQKAGQS